MKTGTILMRRVRVSIFSMVNREGVQYNEQSDTDSLTIG